MGIVDVISQEIIDTWGIDAVNLLSLYEKAYPPDIALKIGDAPGIFDFDIFAGDIGIAGFYINSSYQSLIQLATQDLLIRILTDRNTSRLFPSVGNTNIVKVPKEGISAAIAMSVSESPYISILNNVSIVDSDTDEIIVNISATTPTGDSISIGFKY